VNRVRRVRRVSRVSGVSRTSTDHALRATYQLLAQVLAHHRHLLARHAHVGHDLLGLDHGGLGVHEVHVGHLVRVRVRVRVRLRV
jgi:hypothetical protein